MKKYLSLIALVLAVTSAHADFWTNCTNNGGTIIQANSYGNDKGGLCNDSNNPNLTNNCNGKRFCVSNNTMNWWSSFTWCESIGGKLASFANACPSNQTINSGTCSNLKGTGNGRGRTRTGWQTTHALFVDLSSGEIFYRDPNWVKREHSMPALCEPQ